MKCPHCNLELPDYGPLSECPHCRGPLRIVTGPQRMPDDINWFSFFSVLISAPLLSLAMALGNAGSAMYLIPVMMLVSTIYCSVILARRSAKETGLRILFFCFFALALGFTICFLSALGCSANSLRSSSPPRVTPMPATNSL